MIRRLFTLCSALSLLLCVAASAVLAVRSVLPRHGDIFPPLGYVDVLFYEHGTIGAIHRRYVGRLPASYRLQLFAGTLTLSAAGLSSAGVTSFKARFNIG
jgi:hypothetical protein